jgi:putative transcriptional regulator
MSIVKRKAAEPPRAHRPDWKALGALSDDEIAEQIRANPDAAPDVSDWPMDRAMLTEPLDVKAIRSRLSMTQAQFARTFDLNLAALRDWEQRRRAPRGPARTLLRIIDREPEAARRAIGG